MEGPIGSGGRKTTRSWTRERVGRVLDRADLAAANAPLTLSHDASGWNLV
jgi:hypothetical protein